MKKIVKAVAPFIHPEYLNFKTAPYEAWEKEGGQIACAHYPLRFIHGLVFRFEIPSIYKYSNEARLRFVEPVSISFDTYPDYAFYEIIPMVWDCWPVYFEKMCHWIEKHHVQTAFFTSSQTAEKVKQRFPEMNVKFCPEALDITRYSEGKNLHDRNIDVLEFGRGSSLCINSIPNINYVCTKVNGKFLYTNEQLYEAMGDAKVTIALPRSCTEPELAGDIETLTQRYWENMLSRIIMVGHAPKELVELIGYNPVIEIKKKDIKEQILDILKHIEDYQELVDKNRETALKKGCWSIRMKEAMTWLRECGYEI